MNFEKINMETWNRKSVFNHFIKDIKCVMCVTADVDVTDLVQHCKDANYRFYPVYIYLISKTVNQRKEFKMGYDKDGNVGFWDSISPSYIVFHNEDEAFTKLVTRFTTKFNLFYQRIIKDMERHNDKRAFEVKYTNLNTFDVSCLPWISYKSLDMHIFDSGTYLAPVITWGKYERKENRLIMPLTLQIHHAAADGFHVARFFTDIQKEMEDLAAILMAK